MNIEIDIKSVSYGKKQILKNISFSPSECSLTAVIGKNGSGKSTLISAIAGLISYEGSILLGDNEVKATVGRELAKMLSAMPQELRRPHISVSRLVSYGRSPYLKLGEKLSESDLNIISTSLAAADLLEIQDRYLDCISGGELRRAYFAMMLAQSTGIVLLDEATAFMDADFERRFATMQRELACSKTVVSVMHNLGMAVEYADAILLLDRGEQLFYGSPSELLKTGIIERTFSVERYSADGRIFFA